LVVGLKKMYGIPKELDLSSVVGEFTTQIRVGQFDLQDAAEHYVRQRAAERISGR
jgi:hypothetical protein